MLGRLGLIGTGRLGLTGTGRLGLTGTGQGRMDQSPLLAAVGGGWLSEVQLQTGELDSD